MGLGSQSERRRAFPGGSREQRVRDAQFSLIQSISLPGVLNVKLMLFWDLSV